MDKQCPQCKKTYSVLPHDFDKRTYCSRKCAYKGARKNSTRVCEQCNIKFDVNWSKSKRKYCSIDCSNKAKDMRIKTNCPTCNKEILTPNREVVKGETNYCSRNCYNISQRNKINTTCLFCGKEFKTVQGEIDRGGAKYCNRKCYIQSNSNPAHGNAKGGKRDDLDNIYFRSSWEANYARYLNRLIDLCFIKSWSFESEIFQVGDKTYTPDFVVKGMDNNVTYHEVKGNMTELAQSKLDKMKELHPDKKIILINEQVYKNISKLFSKVIPNWELSGREAYCGR